MNPKTIIIVVLSIFVLALGFLWLNSKAQNKTLQAQVDNLSGPAKMWNKLNGIANKLDGKKEAQMAELAAKNMTDMGKAFRDLAFAKRYVKEYQTGSGLIRDSRAQYEPTRNVWVDSATVCHMVRYMLERNGDGVRLYFSKYPAFTQCYDPQREDPRTSATGPCDYDFMNSIVLSTTHWGIDARGDSGHVDMYSRSPLAKKFGIQKMEDGPYDGLYNYNHLCPPNTDCPGTTLP